MSVKVDVAIKFGGSAITKKEKFEMVNEETMAVAADLLHQCMEHRRTCIVVHGAGSFGHHQAREYSVNSGFQHLTEPELSKVKRGVCLTRQSVTKLQSLVVDCLVSRDVPAMALSPFGVWRTSDGQIERSKTACVEELVGAGFVPVLHGDVCLDTVRGCSILSGDTVIKELCKYLDIQTVVFLTDVNGIYDRPPSELGAKLLPHVPVNTEGCQGLNLVMSTSDFDITGGIRFKLQTATDIVRTSQGRIPVFICHVCSQIAVQVCLSGVTEPQEDGTLVQWG